MMILHFLTILILLLTFTNCEKLEDYGKKRMQEKLSQGQPSLEEIEKWKEKLGLEEAELKELDKKIREMVSTTKTAGALSWRIARAYMKAGAFEISSQYYQKAISENMNDLKDTQDSKPEIHTFESAIPFFEKAMIYRDIEEEMLFEAGLSYANASRDRGWDKPRRTIAVEIFRGLMRKNPNDLRYPYELALIYFDSSQNDGLIEGLDAEGYKDTNKAMKLLYYILKEQESKNLYGDSIPTRFAIANFLYRQGKISQAEKQYKDIKELLEQFQKEGKLKESLEKNPSYQNAVKNLQAIEINRGGSGENGF